MTDEDIDIVVDILAGRDYISRCKGIPYIRDEDIGYLREQRRKNTPWWQIMTKDKPDQGEFIRRYHCS